MSADQTIMNELVDRSKEIIRLKDENYDLKTKLKTCENDYWFMINLLERSSEKYVGDAVKDCIERMKFRKPIFKVNR